MHENAGRTYPPEAAQHDAVVISPLHEHTNRRRTTVRFRSDTVFSLLFRVDVLRVYREITGEIISKNVGCVRYGHVCVFRILLNNKQ